MILNPRVALTSTQHKKERRVRFNACQTYGKKGSETMLCLVIHNSGYTQDNVFMVW